MKIMSIYTSAHVHFCLSTDTSVEELKETTEALQKAAVIHGSLTFPTNQHFNAACTICTSNTYHISTTRCKDDVPNDTTGTSIQPLLKNTRRIFLAWNNEVGRGFLASSVVLPSQIWAQAPSTFYHHFYLYLQPERRHPVFFVIVFIFLLFILIMHTFFWLFIQIIFIFSSAE